MSRKLDPDLLALKRCVVALLAQDPDKRRVTLKYLWARFVVSPPAREQL